MNKIILIGLLLVAGVDANATGVFSMTSQSGGASRLYPTLPIYFDVNMSQSQAKSKGGGLSAEQTLMVWQTGVTFGIGGPVFAGLTYDYRKFSQSSQASLADGDQSGTREFFAPTVGARVYNFVFKLDYQQTGDYRSDRKSLAGNDIAYTSPKGFRGTFLVDLYKGISLGAVYESVTFSTAYEGGVGTSGLADAVTVTQFGLSLAYVY